MSDAYLYAAARTLCGRFGGALSDVRPDNLAATALDAAMIASRQIETGDADLVVAGLSMPRGVPAGR
ncbi:hypothetical protein KVF89_14230 [Nocardioides carbamazepini]|uniref:hypothetical protein n=1 Tax=Nocardioides carbamazepini TaxID=2854259 RepID=UPI00214A7963|nr:hypothetical protein [Nocardioides carbamazepini]MCR1783695.1 hypothetical protein [Nocardioides carbamazepini]